MKHTKNQILNLGLLPLLVLVFSLSPVKAANVIFTFAQTTANGMDLFAAPGGALITNSTSPNVYFSLGYFSSGYDFTSKTRQELLSNITFIASSATNWSNVGSAQATGGKANVNFDNGGSGYNTTSYATNKLVAVVSQGVNPLGGTILDTTPLAIVRGAVSTNSLANWDSIVAPDGSPNPITMALNVDSFSTILIGTYASSVGNVNSTGTTKFDTITLIPEPSSSSLILGSAIIWLVSRKRRKQQTEKTAQNHLKARSFILVFIAGLLISSISGFAQNTVSTPIVGFMKVALPAGKASLVSFPLDQQPLLSGVLTGKSGGVLSTAVSLSAIPATLLNSDSEALYYIELTSGAKSGFIAEVIGKTSGTLTISTQDAAVITGNETFQVKKFKTIGDIFGANNTAGLLGGDSTSSADVIWAVTNGNWRQYFFYDDGFAGEIDPLQWQTPGSIVSKADSRIDPDQGVLIIRKSGSDKSATVTGYVKTTPSFVPFINGVQIVTNPYPVDKTLATLGLKTGDASTGLLEGDSTATSDVVYKLDNGAWRQYFVYNDGFNGDIDPVDWQTPGSVSSQAGVTVTAGEALLIVRRGSSFTWNVANP